MNTGHNSLSEKVVAFFKWIWHHTPGIIRHDAPRKLVAALSALGILLFIQNKVSENYDKENFQISIDEGSFIPSETYYVSGMERENGKVNMIIIGERKALEKIRDRIGDFRLRKKLDGIVPDPDGFAQIQFQRSDLTENLPSQLEIRFTTRPVVKLSQFETVKNIPVQVIYDKKDLAYGFSFAGVRYGTEEKQDLKVTVSCPKEKVSELKRKGVKIKLPLEQCVSEETIIPVKYELPPLCKVVSPDVQNLKVILKRQGNMELSGIPVSITVSPVDLERSQLCHITMDPASVQILYRSKNNEPVKKDSVHAFVKLDDLNFSEKQIPVRIQCDNPDVIIFQQKPRYINVKIEKR